MQIARKVQGLILAEIGFLREDRSQQVKHVARKAQPLFIDGLHLVFATVTFALLGHGTIPSNDAVNLATRLASG
jgi:hypothetical protein